MFKIDEFLRVYEEVELPNSRTVRVRTLSDLEQSAKQAYMLECSVNTTEALQDQESKEYKTQIAPIRHWQREAMYDVLASVRRTTWRQEAERTYRLDIIPVPDNPTDQEKIEVEQRQRAHEKDTITKRIKYAGDAEFSFRAALADKPLEDLIKEAQASAVFLYAYNASYQAGVVFTIWASTKPTWKSVEEVGELPPNIKSFLWAEYERVDSMDVWELTKSLKARTASGVDTKLPVGELADDGLAVGTDTVDVDLRDRATGEMGANTGINLLG
jgi:hypothetical protein